MNIEYLDNVQVTPVPPPNIVPDPGGWTAVNGKQVYLQKYSDGSAICLMSADGKIIQTFYAGSLNYGIFNGGDIVTGGKVQSLYIVFTAADQGRYAVIDLASGQTMENSKISLNSKAQVNPDTDGVWQSSSGTSQMFYVQRFIGGGAVLLISPDAVNGQVFYSPDATANNFTGQDIYNQWTKVLFTFITATTGQIFRMSKDGQPMTWNVTKLSSAK
ncbi:MAG: hypothetical protein HQK58_15845 [Deltaproteobacteria bacterium]|nr:hypothetical protein [Deltaproteobacteria bacterium]